MTINRRNVLRGAIATSAILLAPALPVIAEPKPDWIIMPEFLFTERADRFAEENCWTILYRVMCRITPDWKGYQRTTVGTDTYRQWLRETPPENGIPPHIAFGGAVVAGERDPTFYDRWVARTKAKLASGELT